MAPPKIRCAIYTRKSREEGLDQDFNSLDAQHEACTAYIASQRHEGWVLARDRFDDGGVSGGTLDRPALRRLLAEIDAGHIGMVVVYKIDRLTRSLTDFAKLVEQLDAAGCSFVSVTQAFNTASSMGRLTLNVLLSFAQFEREVTAERIRDKIAASKKQGLWMGGLCPLGYDPHPDPKTRELVVNEAEAETVRMLFGLHEEHGSLVAVEREAARLRLRSKRRTFRSGRTQGGGPLSRGQIHHILCNPVYLGQIRHRDRVWPGRHAAIIEEALWERVQQSLQASAGRQRGQTGSSAQAPLTGKLRDETGDRLTPTHVTKGARLHRYYVSNRLISSGADPSGWRLPARTLESALCSLLADHLEQAAHERRLLTRPDLRRSDSLVSAMRPLVTAMRKREPDTLRDLVASGILGAHEIELILDATALALALDISPDELAPDLRQVTAPAVLRRRGVEAKLVLGQATPAPDAVLLRTLREAHRWTAALREGVPLSPVARDAGHHEPHIRTRAQLAFLSPKLQAAIHDGTVQPDLTLQRLVGTPVPLDWDAQEKMYGV